MRIFLTGSTGFAGSHLVSNLLSQGHEVWGLIHAKTSVHQPQIHQNFHPIQGNLLDKEDLNNAVACAKPDVIYHLAGQAMPGRSWDDPALTTAVNTGGTANLLNAAIAFGRPRVLVVTSADMYGRVKRRQLPLTERSRPKPRHPYGVSKWAAGEMVRVFADRYDLPAVEARPFNHIGPGQTKGFVVPDFASQIAAIKLGQQQPRIRVGNLTAQRDFTDVRDVVTAYQKIAEEGHRGECYLISSGKPTAVQTLLDHLIEISNTSVEVENDPARMRATDVPILFGSSQKLHQELGWKPEIDLRNTLQNVLDEWLDKTRDEIKQALAKKALVSDVAGGVA